MKDIKKPDMNHCTDRQFEKWYWAEHHATCNKCTKSCKQSHVVSLSCPKFEGIK